MKKEDIAFYGICCSDMKKLAGSYATIEKVNKTCPKIVKLTKFSTNKNGDISSDDEPCEFRKYI